jgi:hypothetical protein
MWGVYHYIVEGFKFLFTYYFLFLRQNLAMLLRLTWNSLCSSGWLSERIVIHSSECPFYRMLVMKIKGWDQVGKLI